MTVDNINVEETVKKVVDLISEEKNLSPALKASLEVLILLVSILINRLGLNSRKWWGQVLPFDFPRSRCTILLTVE